MIRMNFILMFFLILGLNLSRGHDIVCRRGRLSKKIKIGEGDSFSFNTQDDSMATYAPKTKCFATYKKQRSCPKMTFSCSEFDLKNNDPKMCKKGDRMILKIGDQKTSYCQKNGPSVEVISGSLRVSFTSNARKQAAGAKCTISCTDETDTTTTMAPTSETTTLTSTPTSEPGSTGAAGAGYSQAWLRGDEPYGHVHEGIRLEARDGWVGVGDRIKEEGSNRRTQVMVRRVDNDGKLVWTYMVGDTHTSSSKMSYSAGYSIIQSGDKLFVGGGLWQKNQNVMKAVVIALDVATGNMLWTKLLNSRPKNGGVRSVIMDGDRIIGTGYTNCEETGFLFVADGAEPMVWELSKTGDLVKESVLNVEGLGQGAKIRKDTSGFIVTSTAWAQIGGQDHEHVALIKLSSDLSVEWSKMYGVKGGSSQVFDMLVDRDGNYLCGGHTTIGTGVVNWDYLALKVNSQTRDVEWRKTYGQPRGFDPRYIHDEMYGVALDPAGNYLLLGGSGDEYPYSATNSTTGEQSDIWVSYLITVDTNGNTLAQGVYGNKLGNNAGEYLSVDNPTGEVMIFTDSDTNGGFGFLKLTPN